LFQRVSNNRTGKLDDTIAPDGVYKLVRRYALALGFKIGAHARVQRPPRMPSITVPTSRKSGNGWDMPTSPRPV